MTRPLSWVKGHGTGNDFVILTDVEQQLELDAELVRTLCDRHFGIGGDGLIRVIPDAAAESGRRWFMDYYNADGSLAEMCGNGSRVFVAHLINEGLLDLPEGASAEIGTRAGVKTVRREGEQFAINLGPWRLDHPEIAQAQGVDHKVLPRGLQTPLMGLGVNVGNPHVVCALPDLADLVALDLSAAPMVEPNPVNGVNVEFVVPGQGVDELRDHTPLGHLGMRVIERGSGETLSCGTGIVASAIAARFWAGDGAPDEWVVDVPGGQCRVRFQGSDHTQGIHAELIGPAVLVAKGELLI